MLWVLKELSHSGGSFEHSQLILKLICQKIFTFLLSKYLIYIEEWVKHTY